MGLAGAFFLLLVGFHVEGAGGVRDLRASVPSLRRGEVILELRIRVFAQLRLAEAWSGLSSSFHLPHL